MIYPLISWIVLIVDTVSYVKKGQMYSVKNRVKRLFLLFI